jgi:hypothetical protein
LDKTELEIDYKEKGKITDYSFRTLDNVRIGVSVTRALGKDFDAGEADRLLKKKLVGVFESSRNVANKDGWEKQVLHVWCENRDIAATIQTCYSGLDDLLKQDTFVLLTTIVDGLVDEIFYASESSANLMRLGGVTINYVQVLCVRCVVLVSYSSFAKGSVFEGGFSSPIVRPGAETACVRFGLWQESHFFWRSAGRFALSDL